MHLSVLAEVVRRDPRYAYEAYEFVRAGLAHTLKMLGAAPKKEAIESAENHVTGPQLVHGIRDLALREFGLMARAVFRSWGINRTDDFGEIVFNLIDAGLMSRSDEDSREDFRDVFDLDEALTQHYEIKLDEL